MKRSVFSCVLVGASSVAAAAPPERDAVFDPLSMDRHTPATTLQVDFGYQMWDEPPFYTNIDVIGLTLGGQFVSSGGIGGYLSIPISHVDATAQFGPLTFEDSGTFLGNIEVGGLYAKWFGATALVLHGGVALPTADEDGPQSANYFQYYASLPRYGDLVQRVPQSTWLRLGLSPMGRTGIALWRADLGLDLALDEDDDNNFVTLSPIVHVSVGGGVDLGVAQLLVELVTNITDADDYDDDSNNDPDNVTSMIAVGARFVAGSLRPGVALQLPIGFDENVGQFDYLDYVLVLSLAIHVPDGQR